MISLFSAASSATTTTRASQIAGKVDDIDRPVMETVEWVTNNLQGLAIGAAVAAGIVGLMLVLRMIGRRVFEQDPHCHGWRGVIGAVLAKTSIAFMIAAAIDIVASYTAIPPRLERAFDILFIIAASLQVAVWARELVIGVVRSRVGEDPGASTLGNAMGIIRVLVSVAAFAIAAIVILDNLGVNVTALVAGLGIGGIAIGLAAQGIFSDLFAGLAIVFDKPFRRGQQISWGGLNADGSAANMGTVERIGLKTTRIRSRTGELIAIANTKLLEQQLTNVDEAKVHRFWLPLSVTYQTDPDTLARMEELVGEVVKPIKGIAMVRCTIKAFAPSSIDFDLVYDDKARSFDTRARNRSDLCIGIARLFAREGIDFAYPTQTTFTAAPDGTMIMPYASVQPVVPVAAAPKKRG